MAPKSLLQLSLEWEENGGLDGMDEDGQLPDSFKVRPGTSPGTPIINPNTIAPPFRATRVCDD